jgi:redox-sensing transcriptional repressor
MRHRKIPDETVQRLPLYLRGLLHITERGQKNISSGELADTLHLNPSQIRKDLSYFGEFGIYGVGYDVKRLLRQMRNILKLNQTPQTALVGVGNLGLALLESPGFQTYGIEIAAAFDNNPRKVGKVVRNVRIEDISQLPNLKRRNIRLGIIAVPADSAQKIADTLVKAGVSGILNFAPFRLKVPAKIKAITIDIALDMARLPYYLPA